MTKILTLGDLAERNAAIAPNKVAFYEEDHAWTYEEFYSLYIDTRERMIDLEVGRTSTAAMMLMNSVHWLAHYAALESREATILLLNPRFGTAEVLHAVEHSGCNTFFIDEMLGRRSGTEFIDALIERGCPAGLRIYYSGRGAGPRELESDAKRDGSTNQFRGGGAECTEGGKVIFTTSGTTSGPKLVVHRSEAVIEHSIRASARVGLDAEGACLLGALPLCGVFGLNSTLAAFSGKSAVVMVREFNGAECRELIGRHKVTHIFGSNELIDAILGDARKEERLETIRFNTYGSFGVEPLKPVGYYMEKGLKPFGMYGQSEVQAIFAVKSSDLELEARVRGGGIPIDEEAEIKILGIDSREILEAGEVGEICIKSNNIMLGYMRGGVVEKVRTDAEGFYATGDLGFCVDRDFTFISRIDDSIRLGGFLTDPKEIENEIRKIDGVRDVAVVGVSANGRSRCCAFVVPEGEGSIDSAKIGEALSGRLADYKIPMLFLGRADLPISEGVNGRKLKRGVLQREAQEHVNKVLLAK